MGLKCLVRSCKNSFARRQKGEIQNVTFHRLPANVTRRNGWIVNMQIYANQMGHFHERSVICSDHFEPKMYEIRDDGRKFLSSTAEPTVFGTWSESSQVGSSSHTDYTFCKIEKLDDDESDAKNMSQFGPPLLYASSLPPVNIVADSTFCKLEKLDDDDSDAKFCPPLIYANSLPPVNSVADSTFCKIEKLSTDGDDDESDAKNMSQFCSPLINTSSLPLVNSDAGNSFCKIEKLSSDDEDDSAANNMPQSCPPLIYASSLPTVNSDSGYSFCKLEKLSSDDVGDSDAKSMSKRCRPLISTTSLPPVHNIPPKIERPRITRIRYPGDMKDLAILSRNQLEHSVRLCRRKVDEQATTIKSLRRKVKAKDRQLATLRYLVRGLKKKCGLPEHVDN